MNLRSSVSYLPFFAPDDAGAGGGAAPAEGAAATEGAQAAGEAAVAAPKSVLDTGSESPPADGAAAKADADGKDGDKPKEEGAPKEGEETPEAKAEREAKEAEAREAETLKSYEALKMPEGIDPKTPMLDRFKQAAAKQGRTAEEAQSLIDAVAPEIKQSIEGPILQWQKTQEEQIALCKGDKEIGGNDEALAKNMGIARRGIDAIMGDEAKPFLEELAMTGAGNFRRFAVFAFRVGKLLGEGEPAGGRTAPSGKPKAVSEIFYPTQAKEA